MQCIRYGLIWCPCHQLCLRKCGEHGDLMTCDNARKRRHLGCRRVCGYLTYSKRSGVQAVNDGKWSRNQVIHYGSNAVSQTSLLCWMYTVNNCDVCALKNQPVQVGPYVLIIRQEKEGYNMQIIVISLRCQHLKEPLRSWTAPAVMTPSVIGVSVCHKN